jgi:hypothetical protein
MEQGSSSAHPSTSVPLSSKVTTKPEACSSSSPPSVDTATEMRGLPKRTCMQGCVGQCWMTGVSDVMLPDACICTSA